MTSPLEEPQVPTGFERWSIVFAAIAGVMVFDFTWLSVGVALPHMQGTFSATSDQIAWVMTAFIVGGTMMIAVTGWASTRFGRKRLYIAAVVGNTLGTFMCGAAGSLEAEVLYRFLQGLSSAPLLALAQSIVIDAFPRDKRGLATGLFGAAGVGAVVLAPVVGGLVVEYYSWRFVFYAVIPFGIVATIVGVVFLPKSEPEPTRRLEVTGFVAVVALVGALQLALSRGERLDWFESSEIQIEMAIAAVALVFVIERNINSTNPLFPISLFTDRNFVVAIVLMLIFGGMVTLPVVLIPLMLQQVQGFPVIDAGLLMLSRGLGSMLSLLLAGTVLARFDPRALLAVGFVCLAVSNLYMSTWTADISTWPIVWTNFIQGCSSGVTYVPIITIGLATMARRLHTEAITFTFLMFNLGSGLGVAAIFALHTRLIQINYSVLTENFSLTSERLRQSPLAESLDLNTPSGLASIAAEIYRQAELIAYLNSFLVIGLVAALTLPLVLFVRKSWG